MGFLIFMSKGSFFLPKVMWAKQTFECLGLKTWGLRVRVEGLGFRGLGLGCRG